MDLKTILVYYIYLLFVHYRTLARFAALRVVELSKYHYSLPSYRYTYVSLRCQFLRRGARTYRTTAFAVPKQDWFGLNIFCYLSLWVGKGLRRWQATSMEERQSSAARAHGAGAFAVTLRVRLRRRSTEYCWQRFSTLRAPPKHRRSASITAPGWWGVPTSSPPRLVWNGLVCARRDCAASQQKSE